MNETNDNGGCPPDCGHSKEEHDAFDAGIVAGRASGLDATENNPFSFKTKWPLWDAWDMGCAVGAQEHDPHSSKIIESNPAK